MPTINLIKIATYTKMGLFIFMTYVVKENNVGKVTGLYVQNDDLCCKGNFFSYFLFILELINYFAMIGLLG